MFLTDNLPKPKYEIISASSHYYGSDTENKSFQKRTIDRIKYSPKKSVIKNTEEFSLPEINKRDSTNIVDQIKNRYKKERKNKQRLESSAVNELLYDIPHKNIKAEGVNISPSRVRDLSNNRSESRSHSLDYPSNKSAQIAKDLVKNPSLESLISRDKSSNYHKLSSAERIASKLSIHKNMRRNMPQGEDNAYDNNLSMQLNELSVLSGRRKPNLFSNKSNSLSNSPRLKNKVAGNYVYNLHQMEYDYSIITKDSRRILSNKKPLRLINPHSIKK